MGLPHILIYAILTGISFGMIYRTSGSSSELGINFVFLDFLSRYSDSGTQSLIIILMLVLAVYSVYRLAKFFREVFEHRLTGIITAGLGFSGSILVIFAPQDNSHVLVVGVGAWIIGIAVVLAKRKNHTKKSSSNLNFKDTT